MPCDAGSPSYTPGRVSTETTAQKAKDFSRLPSRRIGRELALGSVQAPPDKASVSDVARPCAARVLRVEVEGVRVDLKGLGGIRSGSIKSC